MFLPIVLTFWDAQNRPNKCNPYAGGFPILVTRHRVKILLMMAPSDAVLAYAILHFYINGK